jgi:hypothetical protein
LSTRKRRMKEGRKEGRRGAVDDALCCGEDEVFIGAGRRPRRIGERD